jgi:hypothetical protein
MVIESSPHCDPKETENMDLNLDPAVLKGRVQSLKSWLP